MNCICTMRASMDRWNRCCTFVQIVQVKVRGLVCQQAELTSVVYHLVVNRTAKQLQHWLQERMIALRTYLTKHMAREAYEEHRTLAIERIVSKLDQEQRVQVFLRRMFMQRLVMSFNTWAQEVAKTVRTKSFMKRCVQQWIVELQLYL